ncbi:MAG: metallophosphoesterase [Bradymonadia bacterium]
MADEKQRDDDPQLSRRDFMSRAAQASVAVGLMLAGCEEDETTGAVSDQGTGGEPDGQMPDMGMVSPDSDVPDAEVDAPDAEIPDADSPDAAIADHPLARLPEAPITKGPWLHIVGGVVVLRFEALEGFEAEATLTAEGGEPERVELTSETEELEYRWPPFPDRVDFGDYPGTYTLWTGRMTELTPGMRYSWSVEIGPTTVTGAFTAPPAPGQAFTAVWVADTMWPNSIRVGELVASWNPDVVVHGGDIQYMSNPGDTWNGMFQYFAAAMRVAPIQLCVGNHEYEGQEEFTVQYGRLFGIQGSESPRSDLHAFDFGSVRFILMNSETDDQAEPFQTEWLEQQLSTLEADGLQRAVVGFHRPVYTFSKSSANRRVRDVLHPIFQAHNVPLVLTGHNHCYERFDVDGMVYVVDGGGGALSYEIDATRDDVEASYPEEIPLRQVAEETYGATRIEVAADGTMTVERWNIDGEMTDRFVV